jgi:hypothetical protein
MLELEGAVVGLLWNGKPNGDVLFDVLAERLTADFGVATVLRADKEPFALAPAEALDSMAVADLVFCGPGDCGGCTSWSVRDAEEIALRGATAVVLCTSAFVGLAQACVRASTAAGISVLSIEHPLLGKSGHELSEAVSDLLPLLRSSLGAPVDRPPEPDAGSTGAGDAHAAPVALLDLFLEQELGAERSYELLCERGLGDGLPVGGVSARYVTEFLDHLNLSASDVLLAVPPMGSDLTAARLAACAALAGCPPEMARVLSAAVSALSDERLNAFGALTTTGTAAFLVVVNGPARIQLKFNSGANCLGPGTRANASLGRCLSLVTILGGGATPGVEDPSTHGQPAKYTFCVAENEERSPWTPLHVDRGLAASQSAVTLMCASGTVECYENHSTRPSEHIAVLGAVLEALVVSRDVRFGRAQRPAPNPPLVVMAPEWAHHFASEGWSKDDVTVALAAHVATTAIAAGVVQDSADVSVDLVVAGGAGYKQTVIQSSVGRRSSVTVAVA